MEIPILCCTKCTSKKTHTVLLPWACLEQGPSRLTDCQMLMGRRLRWGLPEPCGDSKRMLVSLAARGKVPQDRVRADLYVRERISMCRGRRCALPANGPILVTICSGEWDTCQKQLLTADRSVCGGALWWPGAGHAAGPQERQPCAWCGGRRQENPVPHFLTARVLTTTSCLPGHRFPRYHFHGQKRQQGSLW